MKTLASRRWWTALVWLGLMLLMGTWYVQKAVPDLWQRACWLGEWPFEQGCETQVFRNDPEAMPEAFGQHLQAHVGDAHAWTGLTAALWLREDPSTGEALQAAQLLAPYNTVVLLARADKALNARDWATAAQTLVALVERGHAPARPSLQALMLHPEGQKAVLDQVQPGQQWLDALLASLAPETHPAQVLPLVEQGMQLSLLKPGTVLGLVDRLKRVNHFADAYTLWVAQRGQVPLGVFNGDFETRALRRGFDWEWPQQAAGKTGLRVQQASASPDPGQLLKVEMTGLAALPVPMVSQVLWLPGQAYQLRGRFMTDTVRSREGLVWALRCAQGGERWASTAPLADTHRRWQEFSLDFKVPEACAGAVRLQLEPQAAWEARAGMTGILYFDQLAITPESTGETP